MAPAGKPGRADIADGAGGKAQAGRAYGRDIKAGETLAIGVAGEADYLNHVTDEIASEINYVCRLLHHLPARPT